MFPILTNRILQKQRQFCNGETNSLEQFLLNAPERSSLCNTQSLDITLSIEKQTMDYGASVLRGILGPLEEENVKNAAIYILDPEKNKVLVYLGNRDTPNLPEKNIDMIQEKRSVGSTLKPLIYLLALKNGADSENLVLDSTRAYPTGQEGKYFIPQNYNPKSYGPVRFREALGNSLNSASVRITETIGLGKVYDFLRGA
jgi:penicillin-binding protein 1C